MERIKTISCPNCSATIGVPEGISAVKCPYCGYQISLVNQTVDGLPAFLLPLKVKKADALEILVMELSKQVGVSEECIAAAERAQDKIVVIPYVIYEVNAVGTIKYRNYRGDVAFKGEVSVAVPEKLSWLDDIHIPPEARVPYDPAVFRGAKVLSAENFVGTESRARRLAESKLQSLAEPRGQRAEILEVNVAPVAVVYVPFHYVKFGENRAVINGSNGEVVIATYTQRASARMLALGGGAAAAGVGTLVAAATHGFMPLVIGVAGAVPLLAASVTKSRAFGAKAGTFGIPSVRKLKAMEED